MLCPYCERKDSKVIDSRDSGNGVRRRRECLRCSLRFTTYELIQTRSVAVVKRDGRREEFNQEKLWASLTKACAKRPLPTGSIEKVVGEIDSKIADLGRSEVPCSLIGEMVMDHLRNMDRVAYIRFASVYRDFRDIETFKDEIDALLEPIQTPSKPPNQLSFLDEEIPPITTTTRKRRMGRPRKTQDKIS